MHLNEENRDYININCIKMESEYMERIQKKEFAGRVRWLNDAATEFLPFVSLFWRMKIAFLKIVFEIWIFFFKTS